MPSARRPRQRIETGYAFDDLARVCAADLSVVR